MNFIKRLEIRWKKDRLKRLRRKLEYYQYRGWTEHEEFVKPLVYRLEWEIKDLERGYV